MPHDGCVCARHASTLHEDKFMSGSDRAIGIVIWGEWIQRQERHKRRAACLLKALSCQIKCSVIFECKSRC